MRIGLVWERKSDFPNGGVGPRDADSELFSHEEEDELLSGLRDAGHEVLRIGDGGKLVRRPTYWKKRCDLVFNLSVGYQGIDRKSFVPGVLELAGIPYVGSGAYALTLTRHKYHAKLVVQAAGVRTADSVLWTGPESDGSLAEIVYPAIVKPVAESSSIGIERGRSVVQTATAAAVQARWVCETFAQPALVETFVRGTEVEVPLMGFPRLQPLGVVAITLGGEVVRGDVHLASDAVYDDGYGFQVSVPGLDERVAEAAVTVAVALGVRDYGRVDFRVAEDGTPFFLEASTHPHIQTHSSFFVLAKARGLTYPEMLDEIVSTTARRVGLMP